LIDIHTYKKRHFDRYDMYAAIIILLGTLLRFIFIGLDWPAPYNDEGTLGLMARHIAYQGAHPLLYYGQNYLGSLEAYLGAGFFSLFGPSTFSLRLGLLPLFALFLLWMYLLTRLLYSKSLALIVLIVLALGSPDVLLRQLMAAGGTPEYFTFTSFLLLLTAWLALTSLPPEQARERKSGIGAGGGHLPLSRLLLYGLWGGIAGLDIWSHLLCLPFVIAAAALLVLFCRAELRLAALSLLLLCLLLGMSPLIIYNVTTPITPKELSLFTGAFGGGYREPSYPPPPGSSSLHTTSNVAPASIAPNPLLQIEGTLVVGIPTETNGSALCSINSNDIWPLSGSSSAYTRFCSVVHGGWGLGLSVLLVVAVLTAWKGFWRRWHRDSKDRALLSYDERREAARQAGRLMIAIGAAVSLLAFLLYPEASAVTPTTSARYLVGLLIATPVLLAPLWEKRSSLKLQLSWRALLRTLARYALLFLICLTCLLGTINIFTVQIASSQAAFQEQQELIARLLQMHATRVYTTYDDCDRLAFLSNEKIVCAALDNGLNPGLDRYYPYRAMVASTPNPPYVFPDYAVQTVVFEQKAAEQHIPYRRIVVNIYAIYLPARPLTR
jgi:hypothetical protein